MDFTQGAVMEMEDISISQKENEKLMSELQKAKEGIKWDEKEINFLHRNLSALEEQLPDGRNSVKSVRKQRRKLIKDHLTSTEPPHSNWSPLSFPVSMPAEETQPAWGAPHWEKQADQQFQWQKTSTH